MSVYRLILVCLLLSISSSHLIAQGYIGSNECGECHQTEFEQWQGSHHQLAMAEANKQTVLGDFSNTTFNYNGVTSRFFINDGKYQVTTDNADGELETFEIQYTFGWEPLQQYLVRFADGRMQALGIAWDNRSKDDGGQRWFHLYPEQEVDSDDPLHWTRYGHNWNSNCAECHSTKLEKNYQPDTNTFSTTWEEISVGCEACHGPGKAHADWANKDAELRAKDDTFGLAIDIVDSLSWQRLPDQDHAAINTDSAGAPKQQEVCASCHARRFKWNHDTDASFSNNHDLQGISPDIYHTDGQIQDEVYVYGSFLQSKMHGAGVTCSNCHNPHSNELKAQDNGLCLQCHSAETFNTTKHHLHPPSSDGAVCINCHMPQTTYMVIDPRADHSIRIPRPDLSIGSDVPNACNQCHSDETAEWAAKTLSTAHGKPERNYGESLSKIWGNDSSALNRLLLFMGNEQTPDILQAAAIEQAAAFSDPKALSPAANALNDPNPEVRLAAISALGNLPLRERYQLLFPLLEDKNPIVQLEAAARLIEVPLDQLPKDASNSLKKALDNYEHALKTQLDSPSIATRLGSFYVAKGDLSQAIKAYEQASKIEPYFVPALLNLADVYRLQKNEVKALDTLKKAENIDSEIPEVKYVLGLAYVRAGNRNTATDYFEAATDLAPERSDFRYAWVLSLFELGKHQEAISNAQVGLDLNPDDAEIGYLLGYFYEETGEIEKAVKTYRHVLKKNPNHQAVSGRLEVLTQRR